jgi:D-3-phosphoglycerate dehydrogenase
VLSKITDCVARVGVNIAQQINQSRGDIAYNVIDLDPSIHEEGKQLNLKDLQREMTMLDGVLSTRYVFEAASSLPLGGAMSLRFSQLFSC